MTAPRRYVVRCDRVRCWGGAAHYLYGDRAWTSAQSSAARYTLAEARSIVADGPGRVVRLVGRANGSESPKG